jgi:hypothetical protein
MGDRRGAYMVFVERPDEKRPPGILGIGGRKILKLIFKKGDGKAWTGVIWLGIGTGGGHL